MYNVIAETCSLLSACAFQASLCGELRPVISMYTGAASQMLFQKAAKKVFQGSVGAATLQIGATNIGHEGYLISSVENDSSCSVFFNS